MGVGYQRYQLLILAIILLYSSPILAMFSRLKVFSRPCVRTSLRMSSGRPSELEYAVYRDLTESCLVTEKTCLLLCVSGGVDSMALLHLMGGIKERYLPGLSIEVLNFNHNLRPEESLLEKKTVQKWAQHYHFPFHYVERSSTEPFEDSGVQEAAREWRQETVKTLLEQYRKRGNKASMIAAIVGNDGSDEPAEEHSRVAVAATGHHLDDQLETMMMKITRGVHLSRMYPMLPLSKCGNFIKPLLSVSKEQLEQYMLECSYTWHEDQSNKDRKYKRNEVRMDLIPLMAKLAGDKRQLSRRLLTLAEQSLQYRVWLERESRQYILEHVFSTLNRGQDLCFNVDSFSSLPEPVQYDIIHSVALQSSGVTISYEHCKQIVHLALENPKDGLSSRAVNVAGSWVATRVGNVVRFHDTQLWTELQKNIVTTKCISGDLVIEHPSGVRVQAQDADDIALGEGNIEGLRLNLFNFPRSSAQLGDKYAPLRIRYPQAGDKLGGKKLSEYFRGWKIPVHERELIYVLSMKKDVSHKDDKNDTHGSNEILLGVFMPSGYGESVAAPPYCGRSKRKSDSVLTIEIL